jgi:aspartyl/asparaginyl beta-hydroxylase (cupin superfamily)
MICAYTKGNLNPVALNHGIERLTYRNFAGEVIWQYITNIPDTVYSDPIIELLETNYEQIRCELLEVIHDLEKFPDNDSLANKDGLWSYLNFFDKSGNVNEILSNKCPITFSILELIDPNLIFGFCFISVLNPNTTIASHKGSSAFRYRYHLGIDIPDDGMHRIKVNGNWIHWENGVAFGFNDSLVHEVQSFTQSQKKRVILIVDAWSSSIPKDLANSLKNCKSLLSYGIVNDASIPRD